MSGWVKKPKKSSNVIRYREKFCDGMRAYGMAFDIETFHNFFSGPKIGGHMSFVMENLSGNSTWRMANPLDQYCI